MSRFFTLLFALSLILAVARAEDKPIGKGEPVKPVGSKLDAAKYPQDTPEHALDSIAKSWGSEDFAYFLGWLVTPDSTSRSIEKFKTFEAAVEDQKTNTAKIEGRKVMLAAIQKIQKDPKKQEEKGDIETVRFMAEGGNFIQFEKQKDGRWCMNPRARAAQTK